VLAEEFVHVEGEVSVGHELDGRHPRSMSTCLTCVKRSSERSGRGCSSYRTGRLSSRRPGRESNPAGPRYRKRRVARSTAICRLVSLFIITVLILAFAAWLS